MISVSTALRLRTGGLRWSPAVGDRFVLPDHEIDEIFVLSDMTIELQKHPHGDVIGFNGTTEWALDSVDQTVALWLPRESQLRELLGGTFRGLRPADDGWLVEIEVNGRSNSFAHPDAEEAYGLALEYLVLGPD